MVTENLVRIPDIPGKITFLKKDDKEYVRYLTERKYNAEKKISEPAWILIGRRCETMPGLMYPNDNYEQYFIHKEAEPMSEEMTREEAEFAQKNRTYGMYSPFFEALYHEFRQQTRKRPDSPVNRFKAESLNEVLIPLKEMMQGEEYAGLLGLIEAGGEDGMSYSDAMIVLTQYKSALGKYRRAHR